MKDVLVIGAARSGCAVSKLLVEKGYHVLLTNKDKVDNKEELEKLGIEVYDGGHPAFLIKEYEFVVKNPGIPYSVSFVSEINKINKIYTEIEVGYWYLKDRNIAAITGTNGKTTVTQLTYEIINSVFKTEVAGNIGVPLCELVNDDFTNLVLELSNFQLLGCESFKPHIGVVLNLAPDHLDYMNGDVEAYYKSKMLIYKNMNENDYFLRNVDDENIMKYAVNIKAQVIDFSLDRRDVDLYYHQSQNNIYYKDEILISLDNIKLVGKHNIQNIMVASCIAYLSGVDKESIQKVVNSFIGVEHRLEFVESINGVKYYNDSKATNPDACEVALNAFDDNIILLAGGYDKKLPFDFLNKYDHKIKQIYAYGDTKYQIGDILSDKTVICNDLNEALDKASVFASSGDVILLSPACASYDQFKNFEKRGEYFKELVKKKGSNLC